MRKILLEENSARSCDRFRRYYVRAQHHCNAVPHNFRISYIHIATSTTAYPTCSNISPPFPPLFQPALGVSTAHRNSACGVYARDVRGCSLRPQWVDMLGYECCPYMPHGHSDYRHGVPARSCSCSCCNHRQALAAAEAVEAGGAPAMIVECGRSMLVVRKVLEGGLGCSLENLGSCSIAFEGYN